MQLHIVTENESLYDVRYSITWVLQETVISWYSSNEGKGWKEWNRCCMERDKKTNK